MADDGIIRLPLRPRLVDPTPAHQALAEAKAAVRIAVANLANVSTAKAAANYARLQADLLDHDPRPAA